MRLVIQLPLIVSLLCIAVDSSPRERAGTCREPECGRTENDRSNQDSNRQQDKTPPETSKKKDDSPCGPNPPDKGFVYYKDRSGDGKIYSEPSSDSEAVGQPPRGTRMMYDQVSNRGGRRWYHVKPPGGRSGWLPSYDAACERPTNPPQGPPDRVMDCDIPMANTSSAQGGSRGFAAGSPCEEYQQQHGPVSFR
jgi:hypothetical protein